MDVNTTLKDIMQKYPEDLNSDYNCYWWCTTYEGGPLTYYLLLKDKWIPDVCLRAHSPNMDDLVKLLELYLQTCKY